MRNSKQPPEPTTYESLDTNAEEEHILGRVPLNGSAQRLEAKLNKLTENVAFLTRELTREITNIKGQLRSHLARSDQQLAQTNQRLGMLEATRRTSSARLRAMEAPKGLTDADIKLGGQYLYMVTHPNHKFYVRVIILRSLEQKSAHGETLYTFVRPDNGQQWRDRSAKPASRFLPVPADWVDPIGREEIDPEADL